MYLLPRLVQPALFTLACVLPSIAPDPLSAQTIEPDTYNTTFFDALNPRPPIPPLERYSALWGYTAPDGREYALLGGYTGTHIIDITEKPITQVAFIPGPNSAWREMKTFGHYAYVVNETGEGLQIIDLSDLPNSATLVKSDSSVFRTGHTITQEGNFLYVNGSNVEAGVNQGTLIFNVADDPLNPVLIGNYAERYAHDATIRNDTMYVSAINDGELDIVYLGPDRTTPTLVANIRYPGAGTHNSDLTTDGHYVMTTDEVGTTSKTLKVWDISDKDDIVKVADWTPAPMEIIHNVHIAGNLAYISWYTAGTRIVDISNPAKPVQVAYFDADRSGLALAYAGNWEIYPYFSSGKMIASYMESGLYVFTVDSDRKAGVRGVVRDAVTGDPLPGAIVRVPKFNATIRADAEGRYELEGGIGRLNFTATFLNYLLKEGEITLTEDGAEQDILMTPLELRTVRLIPVDDATSRHVFPFSYTVPTRFEGSVDEDNPLTLTLPNDSAYTVMFGAWGYVPVEITLPPGTAGDLPISLQRGYADNAETDLGWSLGIASDEAASGTWKRYAPQPGYQLQLPDGRTISLAPDADRTPGAGTKAFATATGDYRIDSGTTTLTSPRFNLTGYQRPVLSFDLWYTNDPFFWLPVNDQLYLTVSNDDGDTWTMLEEVTRTTAGWERKSYPLAQVLPTTDRMRFRVIASDSGEQAWVFAAIDNFEVAEEPASGVETPLPQDSIRPSTLTLLPNPLVGDGVLEVDLNSNQSAVWIDLLDGLGRRIGDIYRGEMSEGKTRLPLKGTRLSPGFYVLRFVADDGSVRYLPTTVIR